MNGSYYYVKRDGEIFGPAVPRQLIAAAEKGIIVSSDELSESRDGPWHSAATCVELWQHEQQDGEDQEECLIVWEGPERYGPFSESQLRSLFEHGRLTPGTYVADSAGRLTQLGLYLGITDEPVVAAPSPSEPTEPPPATELSPSGERPHAKQRTWKKPRKPPRRKSPTETQNRLLKEMLSQELETPPAPPDQESHETSKKSRPNRKGDDSVSGSPRGLTFIKTIRSQVRSHSFHEAYSLASFLIAVQAAFYLVAFGAVTTEFLARIASLAVEVFAPFGPSSEQLPETDLVFAGIASVLLCAELLCPIFFLLQGDLDFRLWALASASGVIVGLSISPDALPSVGSLSRWGIIVCGFGIAVSGLWTAWIASVKTRWLVRGLGVSAMTASGALYLAFVSIDELVTFQLDSLPPSLRGESGPALILVGLFLLAIWLAVPFYCLNILSSHTDESTRDYINHYLRGAGVLSFVGLLSIAFLAEGSDLRYLSVPLALLPMTAGAIICAMTPPVMWTLQPAYTAR